MHLSIFFVRVLEIYIEFATVITLQGSRMLQLDLLLFRLEPV